MIFRGLEVQLVEASRDDFDHDFEATGRGGSDNILVNTVSKGTCGRDVSWLPVVGECADNDGAGCESCAERGLENLVKLTGNEEPDGVAENAQVHFQGINLTWHECFQSSELSGALLDLCAAVANSYFIICRSGVGFFGKPLGQFGSGLFDCRQIMTIGKFHHKFFPVPCFLMIANILGQGLVLPGSDTSAGSHGACIAKRRTWWW